MTFRYDSRVVTAVALLASCLLAVVIAPDASSAKTKTKSYRCGDLSLQQTPRGLNGGYITNIRVRGRYRKKSSACRTGRKIALRYYKCRRAKGVRGSCSGRRISGLKCREYQRRIYADPGMLTAKVVCRRGSKRISHTYQQNLR